MGFLFSGIFWGSILILLGVSLIIRIMFNIHVPLFRIIVALILIYFGVRVLVGGSWFRPCCGTNTVVFSEVKTEMSKDSNDYNIIFGKGSVSFTDSALAAQNRRVRVNAIFGAGEIRINPELPAIVRVNSAFSGARMPDGNIVSFGEYTYKTKAYSEKSPALKIDATVVFGGLEITTQ